MLTGNFETPDGVIHPDAVGLCYPLVLQTYPEESARAGFDFNIWHDTATMQSGKKPIIQRSFSVTGAELMTFIGATQGLVISGINLIDAAVTQMESVVLADEEFAGWSAVSAVAE
jgi:hypothetical protein